jgi:hypothetical protein
MMPMRFERKDLPMADATQPDPRPRAGWGSAPYVHGTAALDLLRPPEVAVQCPRCGTGLFPAELADTAGNKVLAFHCILCGTYVEPGHVPDPEVVRTVRGPRGPRR